MEGVMRMLGMLTGDVGPVSPVSLVESRDLAMPALDATANTARACMSWCEAPGCTGKISQISFA